METSKTTVYLTDTNRELLRKASYLANKTKKEVINEALEIGLTAIIKESENK